MNLKKHTLIVFCLVLGLYVKAQTKTPDDVHVQDTAAIGGLLAQSKLHAVDDPELSIKLAQQAIAKSKTANYPKGQALGLKNIGIVFYNQGKYPETLSFWKESLKIFEQINDLPGIANMLNNIGAIYSNQGDDLNALDYTLRSLDISEKTGDKTRIMSALNSIGSIYYNKSDTAKALSYLLRALPICKELNDLSEMVVLYGNIGEIYFDKNDLANAQTYFQNAINVPVNSANKAFSYLGIGKIYLKKANYEQALNYHNQALALSEKLNVKLDILRALKGIGIILERQGKYAESIAFYKRAQELAEELKANVELKEIYERSAIVYSKRNDYGNAYRYQTLYSSIKDTLYNAETDKKLTSMQFDFDLKKKQDEIVLLTKDKSLKDAELKRSRLARNALMLGLGAIFFIAFILFRNYRAKVRTNKVLDQQKDEIEGLLLNILPAEVANELQQTGKSTPRYYDSVAVLFTDFKGFTTIADKMSPSELVEELGTCFMAFDDIIEKHGLEKIKTIGDAYMCAGGIPVPNKNYVINIVRASLEIQDYILQNNIKRQELGQEPWDIRIGIHVGPVVAGVVGKKKYAYDIWGSTVNIASRMESNGIPGHVNISAATYEHIKDRYSCTYRGKIYAKNVGEIDMYLIDQDTVKKEQPAKSSIEQKGLSTEVPA